MCPVCTKPVVICRAQSVLQNGENQKSILFFYPRLWTVKISNLKDYNNEKMAVKEKEPYFNII